MAPVHLFENHDEAYRIWSASAIRDASIVHLDADHDLTWLDVSESVTIGNYLCQAIKDRIATTIYWVVPDGALSSMSVRAVIARQLRAAYPGPRAPLPRGAAVFATELLGARLLVCEVAALNSRWRAAFSEAGRALAMLCAALAQPRRSS